MFKYLEIVEDSTNKVIKRVDISKHSEKSASKVEVGMNINLNHDEFTVKQVTSEKELPAF
jgi:hypothetical protein